QQFASPKATPLDGTPFTGLFVMRVTPVSVYPWGFAPVFAYLTTAATPRLAILSGYCCDVAAILPALTPRTPVQPPSTDTIVTGLFPTLAFAYSPIRTPAL